MMIVFLVLFAFLPALSPKHFEVDTFRSTYLYIMVLITALFAYMNGVILLATWQELREGNKFMDIGRALIGGMFLFFALLGNVMGKVRKNFYIGIRVPWTLASDRVWNDTHRLAAWLMVAGGIIGFLVVILGPADPGGDRRHDRDVPDPRGLLVRSLQVAGAARGLIGSLDFGLLDCGFHRVKGAGFSGFTRPGRSIARGLRARVRRT